MPVLAACSTCTPLPMPSSKLEMSLARLLSAAAVKKLVGLSSAELTLLPVERSFCVVASSAAVDCSESRFWRTDAERTIPVIFIPFWCETSARSPDHSSRETSHPESKFLKKYEWTPSKWPLLARCRNAGRQALPPLYRADRADIAAHSRDPAKAGRVSRLPGVNHIQKGLRPDHLKRRQRAPGNAKANTYLELVTMTAGATSGNGEQAWL